MPQATHGPARYLRAGYAQLNILHAPRAVSKRGWVALFLAAATWIYAAAVVLAFIRLPWPSANTDRAAAWIGMPVQIVALLLLASLFVRPNPRFLRDRAAWGWVLVFTAISPLASVFWNIIRPLETQEVLGPADCIYLIDYCAMTAAFAGFFIRAGGSFRRPRVYLDAITMVVVLMVGLWSLFLAPPAAHGLRSGISFAATFAYSLTICCMMAAAAMLCLQIPSLRGESAIVLLIGAGLVDVAWEIMWLASWLTDRDVVGPFYNYGDVLCFAGVSSAVAAVHVRRSPPPETMVAEHGVDSFVPVLALLVAIALVAGSLASARSWDGWILVGLVGLSAVLLITRQSRARAEVRALNLELAKREADARLTELARRSADLILVVDAAGVVTYASPAAETLIGSTVADVQGTRAALLFGPDYSAALDSLTNRVRAQPNLHAGRELSIQLPNGAARVLKLVAVNQLSNHLIGGIVLTITDITEQRMLEREVLNVAARERIRLSAEIHDGLGQELVGIAMLLQAAAARKNPNSDDTRSQLLAIVGHINRAVGAARDMARGLSPLNVVRGSLSSALKRLVPESGSAIAVQVEVDPTLDERAIDDVSADHLYRIAQEAVNNAVRHSRGSRIVVEVRYFDGTLSLMIQDDGQGFGLVGQENPGIGLRLMEYRARMIGGSLHVDHAKERGTRVEVIMPLVKIRANRA